MIPGRFQVENKKICSHRTRRIYLGEVFFVTKEDLPQAPSKKVVLDDLR